MADPFSTPTRQSVRDGLAPFRAPAPGLAVAVLSLDAALYLASWLAMLATGNAWWQGVIGLCQAMLIARLFLHGHDACHGASFRRGWANQLAGRLAFLPSLTPFSTWELGHNTLHHGFTNLRGKDYVYAPLTKADYDSLPPWRRALERIYRHPLGPGLCYAVEVWWKRLWFPSRRSVETYRAAYLLDSLATAGFLALQLAVVLAVAPSHGQHPLLRVGMAVVLPQCVWNLLMGFVTFQHHTHPSAVWYDDRRQWDPLLAQVENTVHVEFPRPIGLLFGNIMDHTAHHVDVKIPMHRLPEAQRVLEAQFPDQVPVQPWSWRAYVENCRQCKLYDYETRQWLDFDGRAARHSPADTIETCHAADAWSRSPIREAATTTTRS